MCQQIIQFCTSSNKPLLFAGGFISILLAIAIGYTGCTTHSLYTEIDTQIPQSLVLTYYLQLAASGYLALITILSCYAAYYDQKHSIRALALITTLNFVLALVAMLFVPSSTDLATQFAGTLKQAEAKYDFTDKYALKTLLQVSNQQQQLAGSSASLEREEPKDNGGGGGGGGGGGVVQNSTQAGNARQARWAEADKSGGAAVRDLSKHEATIIWDKLQARGCCGLTNGTLEWKSKVPKSCCNVQMTITEGKEIRCKEIDADHNQGCLALIGSTSLNLFIVLALIALVNLYLATITSLSAYKTLHYDEAAQGAYT